MRLALLLPPLFSMRNVGSGVFVQSVYNRLEDNTLRTLSGYPRKSESAKRNPVTSIEANLPVAEAISDRVRTGCRVERSFAFSRDPDPMCFTSRCLLESRFDLLTLVLLPQGPLPRAGMV